MSETKVIKKRLLFFPPFFFTSFFRQLGIISRKIISSLMCGKISSSHRALYIYFLFHDGSFTRRGVATYCTHPSAAKKKASMNTGQYVNWIWWWLVTYAADMMCKWIGEHIITSGKRSMCVWLIGITYKHIHVWTVYQSCFPRMPLWSIQTYVHTCYTNVHVCTITL